MNLYKADQEQKGRHRQHLGAETGFKLCITLHVSLLKMPFQCNFILEHGKGAD